MNNSSIESIAEFIPGFLLEFPSLAHCLPWEIPSLLEAAIVRKISVFNDDYLVNDTIAIHRTANVEQGAILKGPLIIGPHCFIAAHAYLRAGVFLSEGVVIGPGVEIKSSFIGVKSRIAHFNFVGDSLIGDDVNIEAGAVIANHLNERENRNLQFMWSGKLHKTTCEKFGALIGNKACIGANAVISPGTIIPAGSIVPRLALVDQQL